MIDRLKQLFELNRGPAGDDGGFPVMKMEEPDSFLWIDGPDGDRLLKEKWRSGSITRAERRALAKWRRDGYVVFKRLIPPDLIDAALGDLDRFWRERRPVSIDLLSTGERTSIDVVDPSARSAPYKANDLYLVSENVRRIFLHEQIVRFGQLLFDDRVVGCNSLMFEYSTEQPAHVDHIYMTPTPARRLFASWVACEDIAAGSGPLELWPRSHRLAPYDFGESGYHYAPELDSEHSRYIAHATKRLRKKRFLARKGDVLLWHAMLVHGGGPIETEGATRKSMAFHYFSNECMGEESLGEHGDALFMMKGSPEIAT